MIQASRRAFAVLVVATSICFFGGKTSIGIHRQSLIGYADAFCTGRNIHAASHGSKTLPSSLALAARRPGNGNGNGNGNKNVTDMVSYLEKVYQNSNADDSLESSSESNDSGTQTQTQTLQFQTPVTTYMNALDLFDSIDNAPPNELTVVLCFAHYCKTCQRANIPFKQLAYGHGHEQGSTTSPRTRFVRLETSALSPHQFRSLGIDRLPFLQIYRNGICVASCSAVERVGRTSTRLVLRPRLLEALEACRGRSASGWVAFRKAFAPEIEANLAARRGLRETQRHDKHDDDDDDTNNNYNNNYNYNNYNNYNNDAAGGGSADAWYQSVRTLTSEAELLGLLMDGGQSRNGSNINSNNNNNNNSKGNDNDNDNGKNNPEGEEIVVVMVHSHFDPSCRRAQHKFRRVADERRQRQQQKQQQKQQQQQQQQQQEYPHENLNQFQSKCSKGVIDRRPLGE